MESIVPWAAGVGRLSGAGPIDAIDGGLTCRQAGASAEDRRGASLTAHLTNTALTATVRPSQYVVKFSSSREGNREEPFCGRRVQALLQVMVRIGRKLPS